VDAIHVADVIAAWASRHLPVSRDGGVAPGVVEVSETRTSHLAQRVRAGRHAFMVGEPVSFGGDDAGPAPYEHLLAALGDCTSITMRLYAERKGIAAERFSVRLSHRNVHAQDCADCETQEGSIGEITREIIIEGDVPQAERARLIEIADKRPIHRTLTHEIKIRSRLAS
jgi:uncharacterized OsmC-like protein